MTVARTGVGGGSFCCRNSGAPPVYISSYGGSGRGGGGACHSTCGQGKNNPLDRLRNVDVIESLCYYPAKDDSECSDRDGGEPMDMYEVCDDCGEMEYIGEQLPKRKKKPNRKPVTYTRKQRFNFKNPEEDLPVIPAFPEDNDGPPYIWPSVANPKYELLFHNFSI